MEPVKHIASFVAQVFMITFIRKALTSWFALGLLGLVVVAFAVTGIGDPFNTKGAARGTTLARAGGNDIGEPAFLSQYDRIIRRARESNPKLTPQDAVAQGSVGQVLEQMIGASALEDFGGKAGVALSDRAVDGEIASVPAFQSAGRFDEPTYRRLLQQQHISERDLRDGMHGDLIRKLLLTPVAAGVQVPAKLAEPYAALLLELRSGAIATVPAAAMPAPPPPTAAQLASYFKANAARYTIPERRGFRYALLDPSALAAAVAISDKDVQAYYDTNRDALGGSEQRQLLQVVVPDQAKAAALAAAVRGGSSFAAEAAKLGFAAADIDLGLQSETKLAAATSPAVAKAAFAAAPGKVGDPVQSSFGWHVVEVTKVVAPKVRSLADAKPEIVKTLRQTRGESALADAVAKIEDALAAGTSFADVAKAHGLAVETVPPVLREGRDPDAPAYALPPAALPVAAKAFDADPADGASVQQLGKDQFAMVELGKIVRPTPVPFARVHDVVAAQWAIEQRVAAAKRAADAVVAAVNKGTPLDAALAAQQLPPAKPLAGRRIDVARQQQVPPPVQLFLTLPAGATRSLAAPQGQGFYVVHVATVTPGDPAQLPPLAASARSEFAQSAPDEVAAAFAKAVERQVGVSRNPAAISAVTQRILGNGAK